MNGEKLKSKEENEGGYTEEEKQEAMQQAEKESILINLDQKMDFLVFANYRENAKKSGLSSGELQGEIQRIDLVENEYKNGRFELPLAQIRFELDGLHEEEERLLERDKTNTESLEETRQRIKDLSLLEQALLKKSEIPEEVEKVTLDDLKEDLFQDRKLRAERLKRAKSEKADKETIESAHGEYVKYNQFVENFEPDNFQSKLWKELLAEVYKKLGSMDEFLAGQLSATYEACKGKEHLDEVVPKLLRTSLFRQEELKKFRELLEKDLYGSLPKSEEEKEKIDEIRGDIT